MGACLIDSMEDGNNRSGSHPSDPASRYVQENTYTDPEWLREQHIECEKQVSEIATEAGVARRTILTYLDNHGIEKHSWGKKPGSDTYRDEEWLREHYIDRQMSAIEIAETVPVCNGTVHRWLTEHDIETRTVGPQTDGNTDALRDEPWLRTQYVEQQRSGLEIATELDVSNRTVYRWLNKHGIETRGQSECQSPRKKS